MPAPAPTSQPTAASRSEHRGRASRPPPSYSPVVLRLALVGAALLLALPQGGVAATAGHPLFEFGRAGGNIAPFTVAIGADGSVEHSGPVRLAHPGLQLSRTKVRALLATAQAQGFWSLPRRTTCRDALPDFATFYVTIHTDARTRRVSVHGGCRPRFSRIYRALAAAATVTSLRPDDRAATSTASRGRSTRSRSRPAG
jgi:hypothetical protein